MGSFGNAGRDEAEQTASGESLVRVSALVVKASIPFKTTIPYSLVRPKSWLYVVADLGDGPVLIRGVVKLDEERWILPGTEVTVDAQRGGIHPLHRLRLDWGSVPPIRERVAAQDPALVDPFAARRRARDAHRGLPAGFMSAIDEQILAGQEAAIDRPPTPEQALADAGELRQRQGMAPAAVTVAAVRQVIKTSKNINNIPGEPPVRTVVNSHRRGTQAVLAVRTAGKEPYAVFLEKFTMPKWTEPHQWRPGLVSLTDPSDIRISWERSYDIDSALPFRAAIEAGPFGTVLAPGERPPDR